MTKKEDNFSLFGIDKATYEKSKDILPTLNIGKLEVGSKVVLRFIEASPKEMETKSIYKKGEKVKTRNIKVYVDTIFRATEDGKLLEISVQENQTLWLSSKSLSLGVLKLFMANGESLEDVKATISIGMAEYADFGENRCYSVQQTA